MKLPVAFISYIQNVNAVILLRCCCSRWSWAWHQSHPRSQGEKPQQEQVQVCQR